MSDEDQDEDESDGGGDNQQSNPQQPFTPGRVMLESLSTKSKLTIPVIRLEKKPESLLF